jgi:hypothetical protein
MTCLYNCTHKFPGDYPKLLASFFLAVGQDSSQAPSMRNAAFTLLIYFNSLCKFVGIFVLVAIHKCIHRFRVNDTEFWKTIMKWMNRLERILTMVYVVQNYWAYVGFYPSLGPTE